MGKVDTWAGKGKRKAMFRLVLKFCAFHSFPFVLSHALSVSHSHPHPQGPVGKQVYTAQESTPFHQVLYLGPRGTGMDRPRKCDLVPLLLSRKRDGGLYLPVPEHGAGEAGDSKRAAWVSSSPASCECSRGTRQLGQHLWGH